MNSPTITQIQVIVIALLIQSCGGKSKFSREGKYENNNYKLDTNDHETNLDFSKFSGEDIAGAVILQEHLLWEFWNSAKPKFLSGDPFFEIESGGRKTQFKLLNIEKSDQNGVIVYSVTGGISGTFTISFDGKGDVNEVDFRPGFFGHDSMNTKVILLERQ